MGAPMHSLNMTIWNAVDIPNFSSSLLSTLPIWLKNILRVAGWIVQIVAMVMMMTTMAVIAAVFSLSFIA
jgi:hypothetical protein